MDMISGSNPEDGDENLNKNISCLSNESEFPIDDELQNGKNNVNCINYNFKLSLLNLF